MKKNFDLNKVKFRKIVKSDIDDVKNVTESIWDEDYIVRFFDGWISDGGFYGIVYEERLIGFGKISFHPCGVCWLEGLRLHPDFQKLGIGRAFNKFIYLKVESVLKEGRAKHVEFSTYYKNSESLHMAEKNGFEIQERFYVMYRRGSRKKEKPEKLKAFKFDRKIYGKYIPFGWKFVKNCPASEPFMKEKGEFYMNRGLTFYRYGQESTFCFCFEDAQSIASLIPALSGVTGKNFEIMIPEHWGYMIPELKKHGFRFWDRPEEPNVVVLKKMNLKEKK